MNDDTPGHNASDEAFSADLQSTFGGDPTPAHSDGFWANLQTRLDQEPNGPDEDEVVTLELTERENRRPRRPSRVLVAAAAVSVLVALGSVVLTGPGDDTPRETLVASEPESRSPLQRLEDQVQSTELAPLFMVRTTSGESVYTRLVALDRFDGSIWSGEATVELQSTLTLSDLDADSEASGSPTLQPPSAEYTLLENGRRFGDRWLLPVAEGTVAIATDSPIDLRFSAGVMSWRIDTPDALAELPSYTSLYNSIPPGLGTAFQPDSDYPAVPDHNTQLPADFSSVAADLAQTVTLDAGTDFDRAAALEEFFRGGFNYALTAQLDSEADPIDAFLGAQTGTTEQFAGTYTAMVRSLGIPARVVVGYLPGEPVADQPGTYLVRERDAHAWAEVYLAGYWVRFDPTPTRGESTGNPDLPAANRDHWHAPYAVFDCRNGEYLPYSESTDDPLGIHSHQDGIIHIHPFFESAAGKNAVFGLFLDSIDASIGPAGLDTAQGSLPGSATCDGDAAVLHLRKWQFDFVLDTTRPEVIVDDIAGVNFVNDREVYVLALAPVDAELPAFPSERLDVLNSVAGTIGAD